VTSVTHTQNISYNGLMEALNMMYFSSIWLIYDFYSGLYGMDDDIFSVTKVPYICVNEQ
jgi:hypothetical protein